MNIKLDSLGYVFDSASKIWMRADYAGIQYNDGDEIENRIATIIKEANDITVLSTELRQHCTDWPSLYHLTGTRANIMRPFEAIYKNANVLEIGAGCGAITRYLGESGAHVLALEGSPRRAAIARSRARDLDNVTVLAEKFDQFKSTEKFDVVTLIGVLEYANLFTPGDNPALSMLQRVRQLLKPDGKLIIAIENQLGLKYFAGAPEDHLGKPMIGIEGRYRKDQAETYGRKKLQTLLRDANFTNSSFLAPFPDYKLPVSIVTEEGFNEVNFDASAFAWQSARRDPQLPTYCNFSLELAWLETIKNGLGIDLSNSFLICASQNTESILSPDTLAYHYSSGRKAEFCKEAIFEKFENKSIKITYKQLENKLKIKNINNQIIKYICPKNAPYITGKPLSFEFIKIISNDNWTFQQVSFFIKKYVAFLQEELTKVNYHDPIFGQYSTATVNAKLPGYFIDAVPQNIIIQSDNTMALIDKEWETTESIELGHLVYRAMLMLLNQVTRFGQNSTQEIFTRHDLIFNSLREAGYTINSAGVDKYLKLEMQIQDQITGKSDFTYLDWKNNNVLNVFNSSDQINYLNKDIVKRQNHIDYLDDEVIKRQNRIDYLDDILLNKNIDLMQKDKINNEILSELNLKKQEILNYKNSTSWKVTKILRIVSAFIKNL